jgi:hypothetical protein
LRARRIATAALALAGTVAVSVPGPAAAQQPSACAGRGPQHANGPLIVTRERTGRYLAGVPLLTVRPDGSRVRRLTSPGRRTVDGGLFSVSASPDGRWASFIRVGSSATVKLVSLKTRRLRTLPTGTSTSPGLSAGPLAFAPAPWSPDGRWMMVARGTIDTWLMHQDGSAGHVVDAGGMFFTPRAFSPNGRCVLGLFSSGPGAPLQPGIIPSGGGDPTPVAAPPASFRVAEAWRWTPDGRNVIFSGSVGGQAGLYRMAPDGSGLRRLVKVRIGGDAAVFSPDGRLMAYNDRRGTMVRPVTGGRARWLLAGLYVKAWAPRSR